MPIPFRLRDLIADLWAEWECLGERMAALDAELQSVATTDPLTRRLMTVPGVGPMTATALVCKDLNPERFANARQFAAYFGVSGSAVRAEIQAVSRARMLEVSRFCWGSLWISRNFV
ncbi:MAG: IS110 family transposase [Xanthomonadales bacterium]|nr:IS110 family transposase [Xanthomonadales bacterium]